MSVCHSGRSGGDGLRVPLRENFTVTTLGGERRRPAGGAEGVSDGRQDGDRVEARVRVRVRLELLEGSYPCPRLHLYAHQSFHSRPYPSPCPTLSHPRMYPLPYPCRRSYLLVTDTDTVTLHLLSSLFHVTLRLPSLVLSPSPLPCILSFHILSQATPLPLPLPFTYP